MNEAHRVGKQTEGDLIIKLQGKLIGRLFDGIKNKSYRANHYFNSRAIAPTRSNSNQQF